MEGRLRRTDEHGVSCSGKTGRYLQRLQLKVAPWKKLRCLLPDDLCR
jgi:hypothetical protein